MHLRSAFDAISEVQLKEGMLDAKPDLNLLFTLDVLLSEASVARAAQRLRLSPSAMSRALARVRQATGDPILVRAGRGLVPSPRAIELRDRVGQLVRNAESVFRPPEKLNLKQLARTFTMRTSDGFVENFGPALVAHVSAVAPGVRLRFVQKPIKDSAPLREGSVDLETGVIENTTAPELRSQALFQDRFVGVVRRGHPFCQGRVTLPRYTRGKHICVSRTAVDTDAIDEALAKAGQKREIITSVGGFSLALALARGTDMIASVPDRHTANLRMGMHTFSLPVSTPKFTVSLLWHPRMDADLAHKWLRAAVREICAEQLGQGSSDLPAR